MDQDLSDGVGIDAGALGNAAAGSGIAAAAPPSEPTPTLDLAAGGAGPGAPDVPVVSDPAALDAVGADAAATPTAVLVGPNTDAEGMAEEAVHMAQFALGGGGGGGTSDPDDPAELEAAAIVNQMRHGEPPDEPRVPATAPIMRDTGDRWQETLDAVRALAADAVQQLHNKLHLEAYNPIVWGGLQAGQVSEALSTYFGHVRSQIGGSGAAFDWLLDQGRRILQDRYHDDFGGVLQDDIEEALEEEATTCLRWITVRGIARPPDERPADAPAPSVPGVAPAPPSAAVAADTPAVVGGGERATHERALLDETLASLTAETSQRLNVALEAMVVWDSTVLSILRSFRRRVGDALRDAGVTEVAARMEQQMGALRRRYADDYHRPLDTHIQAGLSGEDLEDALDMIGASGPRGEVVRETDAAVPAVDLDAALEPEIHGLAAAIHALPRDEDAPDIADVRAVYGRCVERAVASAPSAMSREGPGIRHWAYAHLNAAYAAVDGLSLEEALRRAAGDRPRLLSRLFETCHILASPDAPARETEADPAGVVETLRGRVSPLHLALERLIAATEDDARRAAIDDIDREHESLCFAARRAGLENAAARTAVEEAYHAETGHHLVARLRLGTREDSASREALARRVGYDLGTVGSADAADRSDREAAFQRLARQMYGHVLSLRDAQLITFTDINAIDATWDEVNAEGANTPFLSVADRRTQFDAAYRAVNHVGFVAHLRGACEGNQDRLDEIGERIQWDLGEVGGSASETEPAEDRLDAALQELNSVFDEEWVDADQVRTAITSARSAALAADVAIPDMVHRFEDRFHRGLAHVIRERVQDLEIRRECLSLIGAREDVSGEMVHDLGGEASEAERRALTAQVERAAASARTVYDGREEPSAINAAARSYVQEWEEHRDGLGTTVADLAAARDLLVRQYTALGGDLVADLQRHGDAVASARRALGFGDLDVVVGRRALASTGVEVSDTGADGRYQSAAASQLDALFRGIEALRRVDTEDEGVDGDARTPQSDIDEMIGAIDRAWDRILAFDEEQPAIGRRRVLALDLYTSTYGIELRRHLTACTTELSEEREQLGARLGMDLGTGRLEPRGLDDVTIERGATLSERSGEDFGIEDARIAAEQLHSALEEANVHALTTVMGGGARGRTSEERRVIREVHDRLYPNETVRYLLASGFADRPGDLAEARSLCGITGSLGVRDRVFALASRGDFDGVHRVLVRVDPTELETLRNDGALMATFREHFSSEQYERLREVMRGAEGIDDIVTERSEIEVFGFGVDDPFGINEDDVDSDLRALARAEYERARREVLAEAAANHTETMPAPERDRRIRVRMHAWAARMSADPSAVDAMVDDFEGDDIDHADISLETTGDRASRLQRIQDNPTSSTLLDDLRELSAAERTALAGDPAFLERLRDNDEETYAQALAILRGSHVDEMAMAARRGDRERMYTSAADLSDAEMRATVAGRIGLADSTEGLANTVGFLNMVEDMRELTERTAAEDLPRERLIFRHKYRILGAAHNEAMDWRTARSATLRAALDCYNEEDPAFTQDARESLATQLQVPLFTALGTQTEGSRDVRDLALSLVRHEAGSPARVTEWGMAGLNDDAATEYGLEHAPDDQVAQNWANIIKDGTHGEQMLPLVRAWRDAGFPDNGDAWRRFRQFRLDTSADIRDVLADPTLGGLFELSGDAELVGWINTARARIRDLPAQAILDALATRDASLNAESARLLPVLNDADRQARTEHIETMESAALDLDEGILSDTDTARGAMSAEAALQEEFNRSIEDGSLSPEEIDALRPLRGDLAAARAEYTELRGEVVTWAKLVGSAIVSAAITAVTAGSGAPVAVAMMTAAAQGTLAITIEEAVNGRNSELVREGLPNTIKDTILAGFTAQAGEWLRAAGGLFAPEGGLIDRAMQWRAAIAASERPGWMFAEGFLEVVSNPTSEFAQEMLRLLGTNVWERGTRLGIDQTLNTFEERLDGHLQRQFIREVINVLWERGAHAVPIETVQSWLESGMGEVIRDEIGEEVADLTLGEDEHDVDARDVATRMGRAGVRAAGSRLVGAVRDQEIDEYMASDEFARVRSRVSFPDWVPAARRDAWLRSVVARGDTRWDESAVSDAIDTRLRALTRAYDSSGAGDLPAEDRTRYLTWVFESAGSAEGRLRMANRAGTRDAHARAPDPTGPPATRTP